LWIIRLERLTPFLVGLTQPFAFDTVEFIKTLRVDLGENRNGEERAGDLDERQPVVVQVVIAHTAPPFMADSGTRKTTATGKVRSSSLAYRVSMAWTSWMRSAGMRARRASSAAVSRLSWVRSSSVNSDICSGCWSFFSSLWIAFSSS